MYRGSRLMNHPVCDSDRRAIACGVVRGKIKLYIYIIHIDISQRFTTVFVPLNRLQIRACYRKSPSNLPSSRLLTAIGFFFRQISKINNVDGFHPPPPVYDPTTRITSLGALGVCIIIYFIHIIYSYTII